MSQTNQPSKAPSLKKFLPGDVIFKEGETGHKVYIIKQGAIRIVAQREDKTVTLGVLKNGACFGEMAVISSAPRVATAIADSAAEVYEIDKSQVDTMIADLSPLFRAIVASLIKRVTTLNNFAAENASIVHPLMSMANLIHLLHQSQAQPAPAPAVNNLGFGAAPANMVEETDQEASIPIKEILETAHSILGLTETITTKHLEKFVQLKLAKIGMENRKRQFTFKPASFVQDTQDLLNALGNSLGNELTAELEYIDLKELAKRMNLNPRTLLDSVLTGRISMDAVVMKQSIVRKSIEDQGRQLF